KRGEGIRITRLRCAARRQHLVRLLVMQRAATERRESGPENHAGIDEIGGLDDALIERTLRFRDHRLDEFTPELFEARFRELSARLDRLSVFPDIKPFTRFFAETAGSDHSLKTRSFARLAENFRNV